MAYPRAKPLGRSLPPRASGLTFGPDDNLYVATLESGIAPGQVLGYDGTTGVFIDVFASGGDLIDARDLTFGPDDNLYVATRPGQVLRYNGTTGAFIDKFLVPEPSAMVLAIVGLMALRIRTTVVSGPM